MIDEAARTTRRPERGERFTWTQPKPTAMPTATGHRSKYDVTLDRLCAMSPKELTTLGRRLRDHEAGEYIWKLLEEGFSDTRERAENE